MGYFRRRRRRKFIKAALITLGAIIAVGGIAFLVYKLFFEYKHQDDEFDDCDCCDCLEGDCDCCDCDFDELEEA